MGYLKIRNLYQVPELATGLLGRVYCLEKIHGTSAHVSWDGAVKFFSGGEKHERFVTLFDQEALKAAFVALGHTSIEAAGPTSTIKYTPIVVYGEAYGGKQQGMSKTYGPDLKFVAFDVKIGETWLSVPDAHDVAKKLGLAFVHYVEAPATVESLDRERDMPSVQAALNGVIDTPKIREGIVIRPLIELQRSDGSRVIAKHKRAEFGETATPREISPDKAVALADAQKIAAEWVTPMRLAHVMGSMGPLTMSDTPAVISAMLADIRAESEGEINWDADKHGIEKAIGRATAKLFKGSLGL